MVSDPLLNNRYRLLKELGKGGMALVYEGKDLMLERTVAIKILRDPFSSDPGFRERFRQEAKAAANLSHPNLVTVYDFGLDSGRLFIVMEHVPGSDLKSLIERKKIFTLTEAIPLLVQACAGIGYAHRAGLVHCDIKPQNLLVTPDKRIKVTDFGIARALASINPDEKQDVVWGSPQYLSPEQASGNAPLPASDVYGIGVVMYEMLTGRLPFDAESGEELVRLHKEAAPVPPSQLIAGLSPSVEQVMMKVLSKEPSARYRTADQLGRVLMTMTPDLAVQKRAKEALNPLQRPGTGELAPLPHLTKKSELARPITVPRPSTPEPVPPQPSFDWVTAGLGLFTFLLVGGLVPFWIWVWLRLNPP